MFPSLKQFFSILVVTVALPLLAACGKYPKRGESVNQGAIIRTIDLNPCAISTYTNDECIIQGFEDLDTSSVGGCAAGQLDIDFNTFSIVGKTITGKCELKIIRHLEIDHGTKQYIFTIKFKDKGICMKQARNYNLVLVPKIPSGYTVLFKLVEE